MKIEIFSSGFYDLAAYVFVGVKVRNMKMDFNTRGTWRRIWQ